MLMEWQAKDWKKKSEKVYKLKVVDRKETYKKLESELEDLIINPALGHKPKTNDTFDQRLLSIYQEWENSRLSAAHRIKEFKHCRDLAIKELQYGLVPKDFDLKNFGQVDALHQAVYKNKKLDKGTRFYYLNAIERLTACLEGIPRLNSNGDFCEDGWDGEDVGDDFFIEQELIDRFIESHRWMGRVSGAIDKAPEMPPNVDAAIIKMIISNHMRIIAGKERPSRIKKPILEATIKFIKEKPDRMKESAEKICNAFIRKHHGEEKEINVIVDGIDSDVYYDEKVICYKSFLKKETIGKSITLNTFKNTYIPLAKKEIQG